MASENPAFDPQAQAATTPLNPHLDAHIRTTMKTQVGQLSASLENSYRNVAHLCDVKQRAKPLLDINTEDSSSAAKKTQLIDQQLGLLEEGLRRGWTLLDMMRGSLGQLVYADYLFRPPSDVELASLQENLRLMREKYLAVIPVRIPMFTSDPDYMMLQYSAGPDGNGTIKTQTEAFLEQIKSLEYSLGQAESLGFEWVEKTMNLETKVENMEQENENLRREVEKLRRENEMLAKGTGLV